MTRWKALRWAAVVALAWLIPRSLWVGDWGEAVAWILVLVWSTCYYNTESDRCRTSVLLETCRDGFRFEGQRHSAEMMEAKAEIKALKRRQRLGGDVMKAIKAKCGLWETGGAGDGAGAMTREQHLDAAEYHGEAARAWMLECDLGVDPVEDAVIAAHHGRAAQKCEACGGRGHYPHSFAPAIRCEQCYGTGWVPMAGWN